MTSNEAIVKECWTKKFIQQKPPSRQTGGITSISIFVKPFWNSASCPEEYKCSSAKFYEKEIKDFD